MRPPAIVRVRYWLRVVRVMALVVSGIVVTLTWSTARAQTQPALDELLSRVGQRIAEFYKRAQHVICIERSRVQPIDHSFSPQGFARIVESELRVEAEGGGSPGEAAVVRQVRKVNGRVPRENDTSLRSN